jgi:protein-L-isoaspartate(D-aspartate) O-methyltransferase
MSNETQAYQLNQKLISAIWKEGMVRAMGVQEAFNAVPRHLFMPDLPLEQVYEDRALPLKYDNSGLLISSCSQPTMIAIMLDQMRLKTGDNVLEIGSASGYNAALMKHIVGTHGNVTTIELDPELAKFANNNLNRARMSDVKVVNADGAYGYLPRAAYDHIVATVGVWDIPPSWIKQLKDGGVLLAPITVDGMQVSAKFTRQADGSLLSVDNRGCAFVYMRGDEGFADIRQQVGSSTLTIVSESAKEAIDTVRLQTLLRADAEIANIEPRLKPQEFWRGLQVYLLMHMPTTAQFVLYTVAEELQSFGLQGHGMAIIMAGSAVFVPYTEIGVAHYFGGSDAFVLLQNLIDQWIKDQRLGMESLRLQLVAKGTPAPTHVNKVYSRRHHDLWVWMEKQATA